MNAYVTSLRAARFTTSPPRHAIRKAKNAALPHWPGETHTRSVSSIIATIPKFVGLNTCFPLKRSTNLLAIATAAAAAVMTSEFVLSSRQRERPEMSGLRGSKAASPQARVQTYCVSSAVPTAAATCAAVISKSSPSRP